MMMFGGSPLIVAAPPRFAQKISARIIGTGLYFSIRDSSIVTVARNRTTVMLSMNIDRKPDMHMKQIRRGTR